MDRKAGKVPKRLSTGGAEKAMDTFGPEDLCIIPSFQKLLTDFLSEVLHKNLIVGKSLSSGCFQSLHMSLISCSSFSKQKQE